MYRERSYPTKGSIALADCMQESESEDNCIFRWLTSYEIHHRFHFLFRNSNASLRIFIKYEEKRCITLLLCKMLHFQQKTLKDISPCIANSKLITSYFHLFDDSKHKRGISNTPTLGLSGSIGFKSHKKWAMGISLYTSSQPWMLEELTVDCVAGFVLLPWHLPNSCPSWSNPGICLVHFYLFSTLTEMHLHSQCLLLEPFIVPLASSMYIYTHIFLYFTFFLLSFLSFSIFSFFNLSSLFFLNLYNGGASMDMNLTGPKGDGQDD